MKQSRIRSLLDDLASRAVPDNTNLWSGIRSRLAQGAPPMRLKMKWSISLVWLLLALALLTTAAYALYRFFNDPGLQAAQDAGLITDLNATAESSVATAQPPFASGSGNATIVGEMQTLEGVTATLDWVYVEDARQAFGMTINGLGEGMRLAIPSMSFSETDPTGFSGATFRLRGDGPVTAVYLVHQFVRPEQSLGGKLSVQVDVPLVAWSADGGTPLGAFRFEIPNVEITVPWGGGGGNSYSVEVNGVEMNMEHVILGPDYTQVRLCYQPPSGADWSIQGAALAFGNPLTNELSHPTEMDSSFRVVAEGHQPCQDIGFPRLAPDGDSVLWVTAEGLAAGDTGEKIDSAWKFSTYIPSQLYIGGIESGMAAAATPLASQTVDDMTATLEWAYMDSNRAAFTVHFSDWRPGFILAQVALRTEGGKDVNVGMNWGPAEGDPATTLINLTPASAIKPDRFKGKLVLGLLTAPAAGASTTEFTFDLDLPVYQALTVESGQVQSAHGQDLMLQMVKATPSYTLAYLCYRKPSAGDWGLGTNLTLQIGADRADAADYVMLYDAEYKDGGKGIEPGWRPAIGDGRCVRVGFPVGHHGTAENLILSIDALQLSMPEVIPPDDVARAREALKAQGIEMDWMTFSGNGGGGGGPVYRQLPEGMTEAEAYQHFVAALGYSRPGPWVFTLEIRP